MELQLVPLGKARIIMILMLQLIQIQAIKQILFSLITPSPEPERTGDINSYSDHDSYPTDHSLGT